MKKKSGKRSAAGGTNVKKSGGKKSPMGVYS